MRKVDQTEGPLHHGDQPGPRIKDFFTRSSRIQIWDRLEWFHLAICFVIIGFFVLLMMLGVFRRAENLFSDAFFRNRQTLKIDPHIALIEIDEESIKAIGPWPWPWHYHAQMIDLLTQGGARAIVFDFLSKEPKVPYESRTIEESLKDKKPFYVPALLEPKHEKKIWVHSLPIVLEPEGAKKVWTHSAPGIEKFSAGKGHLNVEPDPDGVVRKVKPFLEYGDEGYWYLPVKAAYDYLGRELGGLKDLKIPFDGEGNLLINWAGPWQKTYESYSYEELVRDFYSTKQGLGVSKNSEKIKGKICLIGVTAQDVGNFFVSPIESSCPSLGIQAHVVNSVLTRQYMTPAPAVVQVICLIAIGLVASFLFSIFRKVPSLAAGLALAGLWTLNGYALFCINGFLIPIFSPLCLIFVLFIFSAIYSQIVASKEHSRLFDLATRDGLTGVYVIRHFREILNQVVQDAQARKESLSLILIDIDNFKPVNDQYGHPAGDMVLKKTAGLIRSCLRSQRPIGQTDFVARYGGEEFIVLLRDIALDPAASLVGERIRKAVEQGVFQWKDLFIPVRISLGVATLHPGERVPDAMVHRADQALYRAKRTGKNKVCTEAETSN